MKKLMAVFFVLLVCGCNNISKTSDIWRHTNDGCDVVLTIKHVYVPSDESNSIDYLDVYLSNDDNVCEYKLKTNLAYKIRLDGRYNIKVDLSLKDIEQKNYTIVVINRKTGTKLNFSDYE